jgi:short-chain Z-isoprenyl diphosphate synthase
MMYGRRALLRAGLLCGIAFFALAHEAAEQQFFSADYATRAFMQAERSPALDRVMHGLSDLGSGYVLVPLCLALSLALSLRRVPRPWLVPALTGGATLLEGLTKWIVHRPRPKGTAYGFPSGHVMASVVFFGALIYLLWMSSSLRKWRWTGTTLCVVAILGIAYSRLYLNAHWLSDVLGGFIGGAACLTASIAWIDGRSTRGRPRTSGQPVLTPLLYRLYERRLLKHVLRHPLPKHLGLIQDGHRRYAREAGLSNSTGYALGAAKAEEVLTWCAALKIPMVTLWWLSTENFRRSPDEVGAVLDVIETKMDEWLSRGFAERSGIRIRPIGKLDLLPASALQALRHAEAATRDHDCLLLNVGVGYGGRQEIVDAVKGYLEERFAQHETPRDILADLTPETVAKYLYTYDCPDPDLILRTSGEVRLSGFMLWQSAYSEYYFCDAYWPAFRKLDFLRAIRSYQQRQRRFGQ